MMKFCAWLTVNLYGQVPFVKPLNSPARLVFQPVLASIRPNRLIRGPNLLPFLCDLHAKPAFVPVYGIVHFPSSSAARRGIFVVPEQKTFSSSVQERHLLHRNPGPSIHSFVLFVSFCSNSSLSLRLGGFAFKPLNLCALSRSLRETFLTPVLWWPKSQRDYIIQPSVARNELRWVNVQTNHQP
jgi:hypothetical protein